jgi:hypothetical protein
MVLKADINSCEIIDWQTNTGEYNARTLQVEMCEEMRSCAMAFVTFELANGTIYESLIKDGKAEIPLFEIPQFVKIGAYSADIEGDKLTKRYSPTPCYDYVNPGSYSGNGEEPPMPTPGDYANLLEQIAGIEKGTIKEVDVVDLSTCETGVYFTNKIEYKTAVPQPLEDFMPGKALLVVEKTEIGTRFVWNSGNVIFMGLSNENGRFENEFTKYFLNDTITTKNLIADGVNVEQTHNENQIYNANVINEVLKQLSGKIEDNGIRYITEKSAIKIWELPSGIYISKTTGGTNVYLEDNKFVFFNEGSILIVSGKYTTSNIPDSLSFFNKGVIILGASGVNIRDAINGKTRVQLVKNEDGTTTFETEFIGGDIEFQSNKADTITDDSNHYPSLKAVYDYAVAKSSLVTDGVDTSETYDDEQVYNANAINDAFITVANELEELRDKGGSSVSGGSEEEWVELLNTRLAEDVAYVDLVAPDNKKFKKLHIFISTLDAGLSAASKILVKGNATAWLNGSNGEPLTITSGTVNTYAYPVFIIEKGALFPVAFSTMGAINGTVSAYVSMGGVGQNNSLGQDARFINNGPWKIIRIQPQTANVVFKAGVSIYAWGVYE